MSYYDGLNEEIYKHIYQTILDGSVMKISLIMMEGTFGAIFTYDSSCHDYYIINISSSPYTLKADLSINGKIISSVEMV